MKSYLISLLSFVKYYSFKLNYFSTIKKKEIRRFKDSHIGERCFIIGNGPSLKVEDLVKLKNEVTLSCNMIHRLTKNTDWLPYYYFCHDPRYIREFSSELARVKCIHRFIGSYYETHKYVQSGFSNAQRTSFYYLDKNPTRSNVKFSNDVSKKVMPGTTVSYAMIQFAFYMGFKEIYLIGFDHSFSKQIEHGKFRKSNRKDNFEGYGLVSNYVVDKDVISEAFKVALRVSKKSNVKIVNVTRGGELNVFERAELDEILLQKV